VQVLLRQLMKFPLHFERADGFAVLKPYDPSLRRITRDVACALHRISQNKVSRQSAFLQQ
jgi:hypothetical protein